MGTKAQQVISITSARRALSEDVDDRNMRYLFSMTIRTVCVIAAAIVPGWWKWVFAAGAVVLPMLAVLMANAGREPAGKIDQLAEVEPSALPPAAGPTVNPDGSPAPPPPVADQLPAVKTRPAKPSWFQDDSEFLR